VNAKRLRKMSQQPGTTRYRTQTIWSTATTRTRDMDRSITYWTSSSERVIIPVQDLRNLRMRMRSGAGFSIRRLYDYFKVSDRLYLGQDITDHNRAIILYG
jgi:hypothetical protein